MADIDYREGFARAQAEIARLELANKQSMDQADMRSAENVKLRADWQTELAWRKDAYQTIDRLQKFAEEQTALVRANMAATKTALNEIERLRAEQSEALGTFWRAGWNSAMIEAAEIVVIYGSTSADLARQKILAAQRDGHEQKADGNG